MGDNQKQYNANDFAEIWIYNPGDVEIVTRRFMKIQEFLAQFAGLTGWSVLVIGIVAYPYGEWKLQTFFAKNLFSVRIAKKKMDKSEKKSKQKTGN